MKTSQTQNQPPAAGEAAHTLTPRTDAAKFEHFVSGSHHIFVVKEQFAGEMEIELGVTKERLQELRNAHAGLVEALEALLGQVEFNEPRCLGSHYLHATKAATCDDTRVAFAKARAALAKAKEGKPV